MLDSWELFFAVIGLLVGIGGLLTPIVLAAMARDRSLIAMVNTTRDDMQRMIAQSADQTHERINRVRQEYVREDHLNAHLGRIDKRFDDMATELRRSSERVDKGFESIRAMLSIGRGAE